MSSSETSWQAYLETRLETLQGAELLNEVVDRLRPSGLLGDATDDLTALAATLRESPELALRLEQEVRAAIGSRRLVHALAESGILSDRGLWAALRQRLADQFLPLPSPQNDIRRLIREVFKESDWRWLTDVDPLLWEQLFEVFIHERDFIGIPHRDVAAAILGLAQRAGALGIDEELNERLSVVEDYDSPFLELTHLAKRFLEDHAEGRGSVETFDELVARMNECRGLVQQVRDGKSEHGTSLRLTGITRRLLQQLRRMEILVHLVHPRDGEDFVKSLIPVFAEIVAAELRARSLTRVFVEHADLVAFQVTEESAKKGIKYVAESASEYWSFLWKAIAGGAIVAVFATFKALLSKLDVSLAMEAILYSLNYALCFVLIYLSGSILATKQPAMTASTIGRKIDEAQSAAGATAAVAELVVRVWRSQFISFVGNLICAFPVAILIAWGLEYVGVQLADAAKAARLLDDVNPIASGALFFAAVAGVYLFVSGVLSGWFDNQASYSRLRDRLVALPWPRRLRERGERLAKFVSTHIGVVAGNVVLGFFLGTAGTIGVILGLPFDIRHIAFSSANFGIAIQADPGAITTEAAILATAGVISIGFVNFFVSFGLTLAMSLESRRTSFRQWRRLGTALLDRLRVRPRDWFIPPSQVEDAGG